jgi:hypothetical protein
MAQLFIRWYNASYSGLFLSILLLIILPYNLDSQFIPTTDLLLVDLIFNKWRPPGSVEYKL